MYTFVNSATLCLGTAESRLTKKFNLEREDKMARKSGYTDTTIREDKGPTSIRRRPQTMLNSSDIQAVINACYEIVANSVDEAVAGHGGAVKVTVFEDESIMIEDEGRGVPMGWNEVDEKFNYILVYCTLYASGKGKDKGDAYDESEGLNGCGCTVCQFTSDYMDVISVREADDGTVHRYEMHFKEGWPVGELKDEIVPHGTQTGTKTKFRPSKEVFSGENAIEEAVHIARLTLKSITNPGLEFIFKYKDKEAISIKTPGGMKQYIMEHIKEPLSEDVLMLEVTKEDCNDVKGATNPLKNYKGRAEISVAFSVEATVQSAFHNGALLSGGPTADAVCKGVAQALTTQAQAQGLLGAKESFSQADAYNITNFMLQTHCNADFSQYKGQSKTALFNPSIVAMVSDCVQLHVTKWLSSNQDVAGKVIGYALASRKAREDYDNIRKKAIKLLTAPLQKAVKKLKGYLDCESEDPKIRELYIIEGESAKGSASLARIAYFQAIQPLRGKIPNSLKRSLAYLLSEESLILMLLGLFGCGVEIEGDKFLDSLPKFNEDKLNFQKIFLTADADVDGGHIIVLLITMIWVFCPKLIENGYVYTVKTPLFRLDYTLNKKKCSEYFYSDAEKDNKLKELTSLGLKSSAIVVKRFKGLGEMKDKELRDTVMNPEKRVLQQLTVSDGEAVSNLLNILMGTQVDERRKLILDNFATAKYVSL